MCKKKEVKSSGRAIILKTYSSLFGRIIVMAQARKIASVISPWSITLGSVNTVRITQEEQQSLFSNNVAKKNNVTTVEQLPEKCTSVVDGMGLVQRVKGDQATSGDIATTVFSMALKESGKNNRI